jgi:hypothetical protein
MPVKEYFNWTEARQLRFVIIVQKYDGHKKTGETMRDKWEKILSKVESEQQTFSGLLIKQEALKNHFDRLKKQSSGSAEYLRKAQVCLDCRKKQLNCKS